MPSGAGALTRARVPEERRGAQEAATPRGALHGGHQPPLQPSAAEGVGPLCVLSARRRRLHTATRVTISASRVVLRSAVAQSFARAGGCSQRAGPAGGARARAESGPEPVRNVLERPAPRKTPPPRVGGKLRADAPRVSSERAS
eukprot:scaffold1146_cov399-Prasinococcus_capsulatus_cf.AAC.45